MPELLALLPCFTGAVGTKTVAGIAGGVFGGVAPGEKLEKSVEHGEIADDDCDEGFADGPSACLFGAVDSGLGRNELVSRVFKDIENMEPRKRAREFKGGGIGRICLTFSIRMQRRRPKTIMSKPPLNITERTHFLRVTRLDFQIICDWVSVYLFAQGLRYNVRAMAQT